MNFESQLAEQVFRSKYLLEGETEPDQAVERQVNSFAQVFPNMKDEAREYLGKQWFLPAGGVQRAAGNPNKSVSHINCTHVTPVKDNLESIFDSLYKWAKYAAYGQGEGINISNLRPRGSVVHNSSRESTGAVSFMSLYDAVLKVISQQGRRGASLISMDVSHPDIMEFISIKDKPENDPTRIDTANLSVQATNDFMCAVVENKEWTLHFKNKYETIEKKIPAIEIFDKICNMAWKHGCPGFLFIDTARLNSNSDNFGEEFRITGVNACAEQWLDPENVCNLAHVNLAKYHEFGAEGYKKLIRFGMYFGVAVIRNELSEDRSPTKMQKEKLVQMPRVGLGLTGLADYFIDNKIRYGSDKSIESVTDIFKTLASISYKTNCELGKMLGSFPRYTKETMKKSAFIRRLLNEKVIEDSDLDYQYCVACNTIAPVGSMSLVANVGGSGIEPLYSKYMVRRERATTKEYKEWFTFNPYVERYLKAQGLEVTRENADNLKDDYWAMSYNVNAGDKMKLVAEAQKWIDSSISVTFNMPKTSTVEEIKEIYLNAWKSGLKGVTVYREGSLSGILITEQNYNEMMKDKEKEVECLDCNNRPKELPCDIYEMKHKGTPFLVLVGLKDDKPYEIFVSTNEENTFNVEHHKTGIIEKVKSGQYNLKIQNGEVKDAVKNIGKKFDSTYSSLSRLVSISLRYGVPITKILDQLSRDSAFMDFEKVITRVLKNYVKDNEVSGKVCPECGQSLIYTNGCLGCICGFSKCE